MYFIQKDGFSSVCVKFLGRNEVYIFYKQTCLHHIITTHVFEAVWSVNKIFDLNCNKINAAYLMVSSIN